MYLQACAFERAQHQADHPWLLGQIFDEEALCNPGQQGFFFAETNCSTFDNADLEVGLRAACTQGMHPDVLRRV